MFTDPSTPAAPLELWPHQQDALAKLRASLIAGHRRPLIQAPTGFGKTLLAATIAEGACAKGNRLIFTAPALSLIDQTVERFNAQGIHDIGVMQADHWMTDRGRMIQVASVQTLARRKIPPAAIVIIDEAHRNFDSVCAPTNRQQTGCPEQRIDRLLRVLQDKPPFDVREGDRWVSYARPLSRTLP